MLLLICAVAGLIGGFMAQAKGKNVFLWFILCAFFPIAIVFLALSKSEAAPALAAQPAGAPGAPALPGPAPILPSQPNPNQAKWEALLRYDPEIAAAHAQVRPLGEAYADRLAAEYMAIGDKAYLDRIVQEIARTHDADVARKEQWVASRGREQLADLDRKLASANLFEVTGGFALILPDDYRCIQINYGGAGEIFADLATRSNAHPQDRMWRQVNDPERRRRLIADHIDQIRGLALG